MIWAVSLLTYEAYPPLSHWFTEDISRILSLPRLGTAFAARIETVALPQDSPSLPLRLNAFRGDPASSEFDWNFSPNHNSSPNFSTLVGSDLHLILPKLHPGRG